jgi:type VI protein secretion system component VasK
VETEVWGLKLVWWLVIGIVLLALILLVLACLPVLRRLRGLRRGGERLRGLAAAQESLQERTRVLQERTQELAAQAATAQQRMAQIKAGGTAGGVRVTRGRQAGQEFW